MKLAAFLLIVSAMSLGFAFLGFLADTNWNLVYGKIRRFFRKLKRKFS